MDNPTEAQKGFGGTSMWMVYSAFLSGLSIYITVGSFYFCLHMIFFLKDGTNDFHLHIPKKESIISCVVVST